MDGNTTLDAVFANFAQKNRVCLGDGAGGFTSPCSDVSADQNQSRGVALGFVDGDTNLDAVFANAFQKNRVCFGNGSGGFTSPCSDVSTDTNNTEEVALGDVNGDTNLDAVFATFSLTNFPQTNRVCLGDGSGGFTSCSDVGPDLNESRGVALAPRASGDTLALVCELKVKEVEGTSERVADSMHFETFNTDANLVTIWDTFFDSIPGMPLNGMVTLQEDQEVTWAEGTLVMVGVMKVDVKTDPNTPGMKQVKIKKAGKKNGTTTFVSGDGGVNPNLADGGWHEVKIKDMDNVTVTFGSDTVTGFLKELKVKLDKDSTTGTPVVKDFKIDITGLTTAADVKKGTVTSVEVTIPETTVTALALTDYEEKIKDKPDVLGGHTEAEFKRAKEALTEGVDLTSLSDGVNDQLKERKGSCTVSLGGGGGGGVN